LKIKTALGGFPKLFYPQIPQFILIEA